jgi:DNA-binding NtrC family response regulator
MGSMSETSTPTKPTVLIVDDDRGIRGMWSVILDLESYEVLSATDGAEGLAVMRLCEEPLVVVTDINMWGMTGSRMLMIAARNGLLTRRHVALVVSYWVPYVLTPDHIFVRLCRRLHIEMIGQPCTVDEFIGGVERAAAKITARA